MYFSLFQFELKKLKICNVFFNLIYTFLITDTLLANTFFVPTTAGNYLVTLDWILETIQLLWIICTCLTTSNSLLWYGRTTLDYLEHIQLLQIDYLETIWLLRFDWWKLFDCFGPFGTYLATSNQLVGNCSTTLALVTEDCLTTFDYLATSNWLFGNYLVYFTLIAVNCLTTLRCCNCLCFLLETF